jgi:WD40 repeat protein
MNTATGVVKELPVQGSPEAFSGDGSYLLVSNQNEQWLRIVDVKTGKTLWSRDHILINENSGYLWSNANANQFVVTLKQPLSSLTTSPSETADIMTIRDNQVEVKPLEGVTFGG